LRGYGIVRDRCAERAGAFLVLPRQLMLAPRRVQRGERVLPLPHDEGPDEHQPPGGDQDGPGEANPAAHQPSNASGSSSDAWTRRGSRPATYVRRMIRRTGPRGGSSATSGYGAYRRTLRAASWPALASQTTRSGMTTNGT